MKPSNVPPPEPTTPAATPSASAADDPRFEPPLTVRSPGVVTTIAVVLSLLFHVALAVVLVDQPLGYVDMSAMQAQRPPVRVTRAAFDTYLPSPSREEQSTARPPELTSLAQAVIDQPAPEVPTTQPPDAAHLRDLDEQRPDADPSQMSVDLPPFELPEAALAELSPSRPTELDYRDSALAGTDVRPIDASEAARTALTMLTPLAGTGTGDVLGGTPGQTGSLLPEFRPTPPRADPTLPPELANPQIDLPALLLPEAAPPQPAISLDDDFEYRVTRFADNRDPQGWFEVAISARRSLRKLRAMPKDVIYLIDISGSLPQHWVNVISQGVAESLPALNEGDRFNIVLFSDAPVSLAERGVIPATPENLEKAREFLRGARSQGWTDINAALRSLLVRDLEAERAYTLIFISDGLPTRGVTDTRDLINLITRDNDRVAAIHCIGVGDVQNTELLEFLAYRNKGSAVSVDRRRRNDTPQVIRDLMSQLRFPLIKDVRVSFVGLDRDTVYPIHLPDIHQAQTFHVFGRHTAANPERFTMRITGTSADGPVDFTFTRNLADAPEGDRQIAQGWAFQKLHHLYSEIIRLGERDDLLEQVRDLRRQYRLRTLY